MPDATTSPAHEAGLMRLAEELQANDERLTALEQAKLSDPPEPVDLPVAFWAMPELDDIPRAFDLRIEAGYTHNVVWSSNITVAYLDQAEGRGLKVITAIRPELVGHPAIVGGIVADEPDINLGGGAPKYTTAFVIGQAANVRSLWPGLPVFSTIGSPCAASGSAIPDGYRSRVALPLTQWESDDKIYAAYSAPLDVACPQMYTWAGPSVQPRYAKSGATTLSATQAGTRQSDFVSKGITRSAELLDVKRLWALLAPCVFRVASRRDPTVDELTEELMAVRRAGWDGVLYFDISPDKTVPDLINRPTQLAAVGEAINTARTTAL